MYSAHLRDVSRKKWFDFLFRQSCSWKAVKSTKNRQEIAIKSGQLTNGSDR